MDMEIYGLRIFHEVMKEKSFSAAARSLKLSQPTVSQQIAKIEAEIGQKLFERVGHDIIPTHMARSLEVFASDLLQRVDEYAEQLSEGQSQLKGIVRYAMPESCQWTPHYRKIMSQIAAFPGLNFDIQILPNDLISKGLIEGKFDFGFLTGERLAPELRFEKFSDESYSAVAARKDLFLPFSEGRFDEMRLVTYPGWELFFTNWAKAHGLWKKLKDKLKEPTVHIGSISGALHATQAGAGVAIVPNQCVAQSLAEKTLLEWKSAKTVVSSSPMYFVRRVGEKPPKRVELVIQLLKDAKAELG